MSLAIATASTSTVVMALVVACASTDSLAVAIVVVVPTLAMDYVGCLNKQEGSNNNGKIGRPLALAAVVHDGARMNLLQLLCHKYGGSIATVDAARSSSSRYCSSIRLQALAVAAAATTSCKPKHRFSSDV
ncbi:hypothetical protein L7F22_013427 [Adiantum nelumboides]|nr:hypothetical protein [Adiantum nelumboides]